MVWVLPLAVLAAGGIRTSGRQVEFSATVAKRGFERELLGMPGYHLIVWKDGKAAGAAFLCLRLRNRGSLPLWSESPKSFAVLTRPIAPTISTTLT